ncbi:MAG: hypothetical protein H7Z40_22055 [Phycisphaerae bacterium]|nr:hypothetical protein [Gemmatimonadaceae bacterium]
MRIIAVAVAVFTAAVIASLLVDRVNPPVAVVDPGIASVDTTKRSRLLMLHIDSWRYETAIDSTVMPQTAALRKQGASWQLETVFEGFTIPAVRAAFSGHEETQLVSLVQNFSFHALSIGSFFLDASRLGKRTLIIAKEPWVQFGPYFEQRVPADHGESAYVLDHQRPGMALSAYQNEKFDVVICHYEAADWVAHETGVGAPRYRAEFAYADSIVAQFAGAREPNDYLLIYGDHGHSLAGEHKTGISIPSFGLLVGPDVTPGVTAGALAMTNLRYIVSHAIGINLRAAPYNTREISRFLPIAADAAGAVSTTAQGVSHRPGDYALAAIVAVGAALLGFWLSRLAGGTDLTTAALLGASAMFALEQYAQQRFIPSVSLFPLLCIGFAFAPARQHPVQRGVILAVGLWFVVQTVGAGRVESGLVNAPTELLQLVLLYTAAIVAKIFVLRNVSPGTAAPSDTIPSATINRSTNNKLGWPATLGWTTALALLEFRVWDHVAASALVVAAGSVAFWQSRNSATRRAAIIVILQALVYFTLRLPLYQLAWIDLFFVALLLVARNRDNLWVDVLTLTGTTTLTCGWLASSLEWAFLYGIFPAPLVEMQVQYFGPLILAKIPMLLVLAHVIIGRAPARRMVKLLLVYTALRFAVAWLMRLAGASGADLWPLAEQGMYIATFVVAAGAWAWHVRATAYAERAQLA